ncbi:MAG: response regulator transcription factor [Lachnospiraceae bacterium]|nr:response regulator transcription factor [Lachnospiraceae bacterium]
MRIAVIEDEQVHRALLASYIKRWGTDRKVPVSLAAFADAESFLFQWEDTAYDALFVDIQMAGMNGVELAKAVRQKDRSTSLVFTTGIADFWEEGYEVEAMRYLLKPLSEEKVRACLDLINEKKKNDTYVIIHTPEDEIQKLPVEDINYVEAMGHGTRIGLMNSEPAACRESISELTRLLGTKDFQKCHRSYLCSLKNIHKIDRERISFDDGSAVPVSRRMYREVNQAFIAYHTKNGQDLQREGIGSAAGSRERSCYGREAR